MKVYIGYKCYYDYCEIWKSVHRVFDDEIKALIWKEEGKSTETEWREYEEMELT
jgi:hypothetical protein